MEAKIQAVYAEIDRKTREAEQLSKYLKEQQQIAILEEEKEEEDLKRQGIIVGQHVPSLPSRLNLDPSQIAEYENFSSTVLVAKDLMVQNRTNFLRRTGNLPISELAETRKEANMKYMDAMTAEVPHYLLQTHAADLRKERNAVRFEETIQVTKTKRSKKLPTESIDESALKERKLPISAKERMENEKVLASLHHKLNYLRNPRNDPSAVTKMLVKPKAYYVAKQADEVASLSEASDSASLKRKYAKHTIVNDNPLFICEPSSVLFMDFNIGQKYTHNLVFRNTSAVTRSLRVVPPKSPLFTISPLRYPNNSVGGMVAPGMSVSTVLTFIPKELGDFEDCVQVQSESGGAKVRILAQREPPKLSIPPTIGLPDCLVGDAQRSSLVCSNNGGTGKFVLCADGVDMGEVDSAHSSLRIPPFTIYPTSFTLGKGESVELVIEFVPLSMGLLQRQFAIHCDNGQIREFTVQARSKQVQVTVAEINHVQFEYTDHRIFHDLVFRAVPIGADNTQQLVVLNDTGLPVEYEWVWLDASLSKDEMNKAGQEAIRKRMLHDRPFSEPNELDKHDPFHSIGGNDSLLRSVKRSLEDHHDVVSADHENRASRGALEIVPARGVIAGEGAAEFRINYSPKACEQITLQAVMMVKSIPRAALPDEEQAQHLHVLATQGHGKYTRLLSWIEDLSTMSVVPEYETKCGSPSTSLPLMQFSSLIQMVMNQVTPNDSDDGWQEELARFHKIMHLVLKHTYDCRRGVGVNGDDSSVEGDGPAEADEQNMIMIEYYDWDGNLTSKPNLMFPYFISEPLQDVEDEDEEEDEGAIKLPFDQYSSPEQFMLTGIWLDSANACKLLGDAICSMLHEKVMHEAVEYLKDGALNNLASLKLLVHADSAKPKISIVPAFVEVGGELSIGKEFDGEVVFTNHSDAPVQLKVLKDDFTAKRLYSSSSDEIADGMHSTLMDTLEILKSYFTVESDFDYMLLMPHATERFKFKITCSTVGKFEIILPIDPGESGAHVENICVRVATSGPQLRFKAAEIDLGLLGVGQEESRSLTFTNQSNVPAMFVMKPQLYVETTVPKKGTTGAKDISGGTIITSRPNTNREMMPTSARSTASRGSMKSEDFSVADSNATSTDFKIEMKNAIVTIEPSSGVLQPGCSMTVQICGKAGKQPQRIRGTIESRVFDVTGKLEVHRQFLNLRGEVQAPKVLLYPMHQSLGQIYVGRPVAFQFVLENICNLPTKFKFLRPGGQSAMFNFTLSPLKGSLEAKQKLTIEGTFTALTTGLIDDVLSCKLFGISLPLGFSVKALAKGIQLDFNNLKEGDPLPEPLGDPQAVQFPGSDKPPEPGPIRPIGLGEGVPLYERRTARFVIRNLSAIPAPFEIRPRRFVVVDIKGRKKTVLLEMPSTASVSSAMRKDLALAPHEEGTDKFQSQAGKKYIGAIVERREDKKFLKSGLGAAFAFSTAVGIVAPWGVQEVIVHAYNDIPGCYDDDIEVSVAENEIVRKFTLPVRLTVVGCPVVIEKDTVGMTVMPDKGPAELKGQQLLQLGLGLEHGQPLIREFFMKNHGSKSAHVKWMVRGLASKMNGPVKVNITIDHGKVKCRLRFWEDLAKESPFVVEPAGCDIAPYGKAKFKVTLARNTPAVLERAQLTAKVSVQEDEEEDGVSVADSESQPPVALSRAASAAGFAKKNSFSLQMLVEGSFVHPALTIDKHTFSIPLQVTEVPIKEAIPMKAKATLLFSSDGKLGQPCSKFLTVTNPLEMPLLLTLSTDGALVLKDAQEATGHAKKDDKSVASTSSHGRTVSLGPYVSHPPAFAYMHLLNPSPLLCTAIHKAIHRLPAPQTGPRGIVEHLWHGSWQAH